MSLEKLFYLIYACLILYFGSDSCKKNIWENALLGPFTSRWIHLKCCSAYNLWCILATIKSMKTTSVGWTTFENSYIYIIYSYFSLHSFLCWFSYLKINMVNFSLIYIFYIIAKCWSSFTCPKNKFVRIGSFLCVKSC